MNDMGSFNFVDALIIIGPRTNCIVTYYSNAGG